MAVVRKRIEITVEVEALVDDRTDGLVEVLYAQGRDSLTSRQFVTRLRQLGCEVNEHWHTVEPKRMPATWGPGEAPTPHPLVVPVSEAVGKAVVAGLAEREKALTE